MGRGTGHPPGKGSAWDAARAHLAAQRLPPAGLPLGRLGPRGHAASGAQRAPVGSAQQLQRRLRGRAVARGRRGSLLERQQAAAERRAAGLHSALPAVVGALGTREGPVLLRPESHHARPAEAMAAVGAHRLARRALAQGAGGLGWARGKRQGSGGGALEEGTDRDADRGAQVAGLARPETRGKAGDRDAGKARPESRGRGCADGDGEQGRRTRMATGIAGRPAQGPGRRVLHAGSWQWCTPVSRVLTGRYTPPGSWQRCTLSPPPPPRPANSDALQSPARGPTHVLAR